MKIPLTKPYLGIEEENVALEIIKSGWVSQGPKVKEFEEKFAEYVGVKYAIATTSCTTALHLSLILVGIKEGDEVICPSYTFIASSNAILYTGAQPVFIDVDENTFNIDPSKIEEAITDRTKAILAVDQIGLPCESDEIQKIAQKHKLTVIEDAAPAIGSEYKGRKIGSISELSCFSFHPRKIITTGEGGMITMNDETLVKKAQMLRTHGASVSAFQRHKSDSVSLENYPYLGYNYRMTDIQAAIGIEQLGKLDEIIQKRKELALKYDQVFNNNKFILIPEVPEYIDFNYQSYMIKIADDSPKSRDRIMKELEDEGISTRPGVMAIHTQPYYVKKFGKINLPITEKLLDSTIILPLYPAMTREEQNYTIDSLLKIMSY